MGNDHIILYRKFLVSQGLAKVLLSKNMEKDSDNENPMMIESDGEEESTGIVIDNTKRCLNILYSVDKMIYFE